MYTHIQEERNKKERRIVQDRTTRQNVQYVWSFIPIETPRHTLVQHKRAGESNRRLDVSGKRSKSVTLVESLTLKYDICPRVQFLKMCGLLGHDESGNGCFSSHVFISFVYSFIFILPPLSDIFLFCKTGSEFM